MRLCDDSNGAVLNHRAARLGSREAQIMEGDLRRELQPTPIVGTVVGGPPVVSTSERCREKRIEIILHLDMSSVRTEEDGDGDAFDVHRLQM